MRRIVVLIVIIQLFSNNLFAATGEGVSPVATFNSYFLVSSPNGSESWEASSSQNITWASLTTGKTLKLELSTDSGNSWSQITSGVSIEDKIYSWAVPGSPSDNCLIKISNSANPTIKDLSDALFSITPSSISSITVGNITCYGNTISLISGNKYSISGYANINEILFFDGEITVDKDNNTIEGNCRIFLKDIPALGSVNLYDGQFSFNVQAKLLEGTVNSVNNLFTLGKLPVHLNNIEILSDGIRIDGKLIMPEVMGNFGAEISTLQISKSNGVQVVGGVYIKSISFHGFELKDLHLEFDTIENTFKGGGTLKTKPLTITAGAEIINGKLDAIDVWVEIGHPIPLGTTGLSLSEGGGHVSGIASPPMTLALGISLVPTVQGSFDVVELKELKLAYTFGTKFEGSGKLNIFGKSLANAWLVITSNRTSLGGDVNIADILIGNADASIYKTDAKLNFEGNLTAILQLPYREDFPFDVIDAIPFVDLPLTLARSENHIRNSHIWGSVHIALLFELSYYLEWKDNNIDVFWGTDYSSLNSGLFGASSLMNNQALRRNNRFEGQSLILNSSSVQKGFKILNTSMLQSFNIGSSLPMLIVRLEGESATPEYSITLANGTLVNKDNVDQFTNIEYFENVNLKKGFYLLKNPPLGEYTLDITNVSTYYLDVFGANMSPNIELGKINYNENTIDIEWNDSDPDNNALINLYYDIDNYGANGVLIAEGISEDDGKNNYNWSLDELVSGDYYIYATISDGVNKPVISYSSNPVKMINMQAPSEPQNLEYTMTDTSVTLTWTKISDAPYNYNLYYSSKNILDFNSSSYNLGDTSSFIFSNFVPGKEYKFAVTASDTLYNESGFSNIITVAFNSATLNNSPAILEQNFPSSAYTNTKLSYQVQAFDADSDPLLYSLKTAPTGMTIDNSGKLEWTPAIVQRGNHLVLIKVDDQKGLADSSAFRINVLDSLSSKGNISFNKSIYYSLAEKPIINLKDINLNTTPTAIDSHFVIVTSKKNKVGILLTAHETTANSGEFTSSFKLSNGTGDETTLEVNLNDTLSTIYNDDFPARIVLAESYIIDTVTVGILEDQNSYVKQYQLSNAYPNPFNPATTIHFYLPEAADVKMVIYNSLGEIVKELVNEYRQQGSHFVVWDGKNLSNSKVSSGVYFYTFEANGNEGKTIISKKMILLK